MTTPVQHPSLIVETRADGDHWVECRTCGRCNYLSKGAILHARRCSSRAQYSTTAPVADPVRTPDHLGAFAATVHRTALTKGRDDDALAAVRGGYLSEGNAMNTDD